MKNIVLRYAEKVGVVCMIALIVSAILGIRSASAVAAWCLLADLAAAWYVDPVRRPRNGNTDGKCRCKK